MDGLQDFLARQKGDLIDRWRRQLLASGEAGFPLDPQTGGLLPRLLEATQQALAHPYQPLAVGTARTTAIRCSLLTDFISDAAAEADPDLPVEQQRRLCEALARASIELGLQELAPAPAPTPRLATVAHDLRTWMTAVQLSLDLLQRRHQLPDTRAARSLVKSLASLRLCAENLALDEVLAGGLRSEPLGVPSLLGDASTEASAQARRRGVHLVVAESPSPVLCSADPRLVRPTLRALLHAALEASRRGARLVLQAARKRDRARLEIVVDKTRPKRPPSAELALARRVAKLQGGSVELRQGRDSACVFTFELPAGARGRAPASSRRNNAPAR